MNKNEFISALKELNINLSSIQCEQLDTYAQFLLEYNEHTNLTSIKTIDEVYLKHFYDSLTLSYVVDLSQGSILDVGTGAGFPGLVLAIVYPNLQVTLLDSNNKKITFLQECISKLKLHNATTIYQRAEEYTSTHRECYDYVVSRAVAELRILLELNVPALKVKGIFIAMKGNINSELDNSKNTLKELKCQLMETKEFELPNNEGHRSLIKIEKEAITPLKYPRTYDKIKKRPI